ncbi:hypothetical protein [Burkholderia sp. LMG 13014]|uniref:hypothetical protein n=1 Tax=Burkholderia sp. LMG 13014 TaxID=2709306 RepID=UPI001964ECCF|nr:hypothetical protein [Burkholderia sp. LMG 13014]
MKKELIDSAASAVVSATAPIAGPLGGVATLWTWLKGHDISWFVGVLTIFVLLLQIRDRLFPRKAQGGTQ